jgi:polysaccharide export outer membrane protein
VDIFSVVSPLNLMNRFLRWQAPRIVSLSVLTCFAVNMLAQETAPPPATPPNVPAQTAPTQSTPTNPSKTSAAPGAGAPVDSSKYKIGPGDVLLIRVWDEGAFSGPVAVHEDGKITLMLVGDLDVGGKTPIEAQDVVAKALKRYVNNPLVTVTVQDVGSKRYYLDGLANRPGEYPLVTPTTVLEAISKAGGLNEFANTKKIYILRGDKQIRFNYHDVIRGKNMDQNILLKPGDHIVVR